MIPLSYFFEEYFGGQYAKQQLLDYGQIRHPPLGTYTGQRPGCQWSLFQ